MQWFGEELSEDLNCVFGVAMWELDYVVGGFWRVDPGRWKFLGNIIVLSGPIEGGEGGG